MGAECHQHQSQRIARHLRWPWMSVQRRWRFRVRRGTAGAQGIPGGKSYYWLTLFPISEVTFLVAIPAPRNTLLARLWQRQPCDHVLPGADFAFAVIPLYARKIYYRQPHKPTMIFHI